MTQLIVTPIDMAEAGSYAKRKRLLRAYAGMQSAMQGNDVVALVAAYDAIEEMVVANLVTDDGTSVAEALEMASADQFDVLMRGLLGGETIPPVKSAP
jgi:hypothetical protein